MVILASLFAGAISLAQSNALQTAPRGAIPVHAASAAEVARGDYLARVGDCAACHSVPGSPAFSGGLALNSPFGAIYSTNITPDKETGIGAYTLEDFERALRQGETPRHRLYPAMPYTSFAKVSTADIEALYAYFMNGVEPVRRTPPQTNLPFPFNQRWGLALWDVAFLDEGSYRPRAGENQVWNRGAYIVQGLGHCGSCHTPRGVAYEERGYDEGSSHFLTGGVNDHWFAPNLTGDPASGLGRWTEADIEQFLKTGHGAHTIAFGPMTQVVTDSTQHVDDADLKSIAHYLKSLPQQATSGAYRPYSEVAARSAAWMLNGEVRIPGAGLFMNFCASCHGVDGRGDAMKAPALAGSAVVLSGNPISVIRIILEGGKPHQPAGVPKIDPMPAFADHLNDREIAEVGSFLRKTWGNDAAPIRESAVAGERAASNATKK